ncbi:MAG: alpha/beta hydrolase [bacterium]
MPSRDTPLAIPDCPLFVTERGPRDAPPLLLIHGICASTRYWTARMDGLARDYHCFIPDLLGHGESPKPDNIAYDLNDQANALAPLLRFLATTYSHPIPIICHSMGNLITFELRRRHPEQIGLHLGLAIPYFPTTLDGHSMVRTLSPVAQLTLTDPWWATHVMQLARKTRGKLGYHWFKYSYGLPRDCWEDGFAITWKSLMGSLHNLILASDIPQLITDAGDHPMHWWHGTGDLSAPFRHAQILHDRFPDLPFHVIPKGTHNTWIFQNHQLQTEFATHLKEFYARQA